MRFGLDAESGGFDSPRRNALTRTTVIPMAESGGFEPPVRFDTYDSLANCWFKPLTQLSIFIYNYLLVRQFIPIVRGGLSHSPNSLIIQETFPVSQSDANINDNSSDKQNWLPNITISYQDINFKAL